MPIISFGLNHRHAGIDLRGRASILPQDLSDSLRHLVLSASFIQEAMILSTCNRTELHCAVDTNEYGTAKDHLLRWLASHRNITLAELSEKTYCHWETDAIRHLMSVAVGLDSQILGEPQIFGQFKTAYLAGVSANTIGPELEPVITFVLRTGKRIRNETEIGRHSISLAQATLSVGQQIFSNFSEVQVLLLGAGDIIRLMSKHLATAGIKSIDVANRTIENAQSIATEVHGAAIPLAEIGDLLHKYDIVISSTNSSGPIVSKEVVELACRLRRYKPMFFADLAVPRDIDPQISSLKHVYVYTIDDLATIIQSNLESRQASVEQVAKLIDDGVEQLGVDQRVRQAADSVTQFRQSMEQIRDRQIDVARARLQAGGDPHEVIEILANELTNKLAHTPTMALREVSAAADDELLERLRSAYGLKK